MIRVRDEGPDGGGAADCIARPTTCRRTSSRAPTSANAGSRRSPGTTPGSEGLGGEFGEASGGQFDRRVAADCWRAQPAQPGLCLPPVRLDRAGQYRPWAGRRCGRRPRRGHHQGPRPHYRLQSALHAPRSSPRCRCRPLPRRPATWRASAPTPIAVTDCLNFGNPEKPQRRLAVDRSHCRRSRRRAAALDVPVVSGNVSLYNETAGRAIPPTPTVGMVGLLEDVPPARVPHGFAPGRMQVILLGPAPTRSARASFGRDADGFPSFRSRTPSAVWAICSERRQSRRVLQLGPGRGRWWPGCCARGMRATRRVLAPHVHADEGPSMESTLFSEDQGRAVVTCEASDAVETLHRRWRTPHRIPAAVVGSDGWRPPASWRSPWTSGLTAFAPPGSGQLVSEQPRETCGVVAIARRVCDEPARTDILRPVRAPASWSRERRVSCTADGREPAQPHGHGPGQPGLSRARPGQAGRATEHRPHPLLDDWLAVAPKTRSRSSSLRLPPPLGPRAAWHWRTTATWSTSTPMRGRGRGAWASARGRRPIPS